jgi:hypothetical protein
MTDQSSRESDTNPPRLGAFTFFEECPLTP